MWTWVSISLACFLAVEMPGHTVTPCLTVRETANGFSQRLRHFAFPPAVRGDPSLSTSLPMLVGSTCLSIIAVVPSKGFYAQRSNTQEGFWIQRCHSCWPFLQREPFRLPDHLRAGGLLCTAEFSSGFPCKFP